MLDLIIRVVAENQIFIYLNEDGHSSRHFLPTIWARFADKLVRTLGAESMSTGNQCRGPLVHAADMAHQWFVAVMFTRGCRW